MSCPPGQGLVACVMTVSWPLGQGLEACVMSTRTGAGGLCHGPLG